MLAYGLFLLSGLALGALYSLGGVGLVLLNRATGVLNFAYGAIGAVGAMVAWQILNWEGRNRWHGPRASEPGFCFRSLSESCWHQASRTASPWSKRLRPSASLSRCWA